MGAWTGGLKQRKKQMKEKKSDFRWRPEDRLQGPTVHDTLGVLVGKLSLL